MTGEGKYDPEYERLCYKYRHLFSGRDFGLGASWRMPDWFVNKDPVSEGVRYEVAFIIPSLEHLNKMLVEQIRLRQEKDVPENILLVFDSEVPVWLLAVQLKRYTFRTLGNSPHAAFLQCIHKMSAHVATELHVDKHPYSFRTRRKQQERSYQDEQQQMHFTHEYITLCRKHRSFFRTRIRMRSEWYGNVHTGEIKRYGKKPLGACASEWFYIPELDELFAFLKNQIMLTQESVKPAEMVVLNYQPESGWEVLIKLENVTAHNANGGKSPHEVLFKVLFGMAAFDVKCTKTLDPRISVNPQRFREFAWRMELEGNPDLCVDPPDPEPAINRVSKEGQSAKKHKGLLAKLVDAFRKFHRNVSKVVIRLHTLRNGW